jgi:hypothetical protein
MKIIQSPSEVQVGNMRFLADTRYVVSDMVAGSICSAVHGLMRIVADAHIYSRPWRGEALTGKSIIIYRALGIGDEFLAARLAWIAKKRHGADKVTFACFEPHHHFWAGQSDLPFALTGAAVPFSDWQAADYHVAGERWWEALGTADQPDTWDCMAAACGIAIAPEDRRPLIPVSNGEPLQKTRELVAPWIKDRPLVLWQLCATSRIRSYPPEETRKAMTAVLDQTPASIIATGHPVHMAHYGVAESDRVAHYSGGVPGLMALVQIASEQARSCVVCPDSVVGHIAAAWPSLPVVSLWSSFDPRTRVACYPNHRPIYNKIKCSPCWAHEYNGNPEQYQGCPHTACNDYCAGLRTIAPTRIAEEVAKIVGGKVTP